MKRGLIFTSAGDNSNVLSWKIPMGWDMVIVFYGNNNKIAQLLKRKVAKNCFFSHKGTKWGNLNWVINENLIDLKDYKFVFVSDDDAIFKKGNVETVVQKMKEKRIKIGTFSQHKSGRRSHRCLRHRKNINKSRRKVDIIECNYPIFKSSFLQMFMNKHYDERLSRGYGMDFHYMHVLHSIDGKAIVTDRAIVKNPYRKERECLKNPGGRDIWLKVQKELNISLP